MKLKTSITKQKSVSQTVHSTYATKPVDEHRTQTQLAIGIELLVTFKSHGRTEMSSTE